jgi:hypothetical protein
MESHDEERTMYKALTYGKKNGTYDVKNDTTALKRAGLSACFFLPLPGSKMIWQFGELGYDYSINTCSDAVTVSSDCRFSEKPIRWDYRNDSLRVALYNLYSRLLQLKTSYSVFSSDSTDYSLTGAQKYFVWKSAERNVFAIGNFDVVSGSVTVRLPETGLWYSLLDKINIHVETTSYTVTLQPGEYHLYADHQLAGENGTGEVPDKKKSL